MKKEPINFEERKRFFQKSYSTICIFFCIVIISLSTFAWHKGANLKSILISGFLMLGGVISSLIFAYYRSISTIRKYADYKPALETRNTRLNYFQYLWVFASIVFAILGLIVIFAKKMFLLGVILEAIGAVLMIIGSKSFLPKKPVHPEKST
jgi:hypothetical protein